ncbi:hypothetical protein DFP72DRAFT_878462 [Ephemerocybe angulata]|uniref:Uncharacterized protein n=1 Tax=Ephemerocybe angulata TaxID=980116 RepID=A0A8H6IB88_9AGAR|nr:hypothetical protein DFP72DRAFT_878462 [Tulosesus angulatus]
MASSSSLRRDMSYRKPVPKYQPSPPPSPLPAPQLPPVDLELLQVTDHFLSLPLGWSPSQEPRPLPREPRAELLVPTMIPREYPLSERRATTAMSHRGVSPMNSGSPDSSMSEDGEGLQDPRATPDRKRRRLHREYRPPTPPLPAQHKRRRLTVTAFPEEGIAMSASACPSRDTSRMYGGSIRPTPSFVTEKTFVSLGAAPTMNSNHGSSGWSGGLTTFVSESDPRLSVHPYSLPLYNGPRARKSSSFSELEFDKTEYQAPTTISSRVSGALTSFRAGLKSFLMFCC